MPSHVIHPEWPEVPENLPEHDWDLPGSLYDLQYALTFPARNADPLAPGGTETLKLQDVDKLERYSLQYHGEKADPKVVGGSELELFTVGKLKDGRWFSIEAWNDYTGWECQDGSEVRTGRTEEDVVLYGLTKSGRNDLGYPEPA